MLTGFVLFYVGAVLCLNGLWMLGRIQDREIVVINVATAVVSGAVTLHDAFGAGADAGSIRNAALGLLFCITYAWVAHNRLADVDGRGLGWFSLFVAITAVPVFLRALSEAHDLSTIWQAVNWAVWAVLWFLYFVLLALQKPIQRQTALFTLATGVCTGWIPGFLLLNGWL